MAFCPGCGYEFREGLRRCPDCDVDLVASLDDVDGAKARRLRGGKTVSIFSSSRAAVEALAALLDQEGIPAVIKPANTFVPAAVMDAGQSPAADLHVAERDARAHDELIKELIAAVGDGDAPHPRAT